MAVRALLLESMLHEIEVVRFLGGKLSNVPPDRLDWRPSPGQRSTIELLRYLTYCGWRVAEVTLSGNAALREEVAKEAESVDLAGFDAAMQRHAERLKGLVERIGNLDEPATLPWGIETTVAGVFLNASLKFLTAYRMQLFLYLKQMGVEGLGTPQCWLGRDPE